MFSVRRNLRRAGRLKKSERTSICVPGASPPSRTVSIAPPLTMTSVPARALALAGGEAEARDAGDAGQRFAAKTEGVDGREIGARADLAGGVALQAEQRVVAVHAACRHRPRGGRRCRRGGWRPRCGWRRRRWSFRPTPSPREAGRSTTSPAATWLATVSGRRWMRAMRRKSEGQESPRTRPDCTNQRWRENGPRARFCPLDTGGRRD